jgi:hypothetical protein
MARLELIWNPFDPFDPGPRIDVMITNSSDLIDAGRSIGLEYPEPRPIKALLDTGASVTVVSKAFANYCKLRQTNAGREIRGLGAINKCGEHAGTISFPNTLLKSFDTIPIVSAEFKQEPHYACLIGRDILMHWRVTFDGQSKRVIIID